MAGSFATSTGKGLDPKFERLEDIPGSDMTGLRLELHGGTYMKQNQMAIIDMQCDPERTGNEKSPVKEGKGGEDEKLRSSAIDPRDESKHDDDDGDDNDDDNDDEENDNENSLRFVSYKEEDEKKGIHVLRLDWRTKYACQSYEEDDDEGTGKGGKGRRWGFFTWFIVMYVPFFFASSGNPPKLHSVRLGSVLTLSACTVSSSALPLT